MRVCVCVCCVLFVLFVLCVLCVCVCVCDICCVVLCVLCCMWTQKIILAEKAQMTKLPAFFSQVEIQWFNASHTFYLFSTPNNIKFRFSTFSAAGISLFCIAFFRFHLILAPHSPHSPPHSLHPHSPHSPPHSPQSPFGSSLVDAWSQKSQVGVVRISCTSASSVRVLRVPHTF